MLHTGYLKLLREGNSDRKSKRVEVSYARPYRCFLSKPQHHAYNAIYKTQTNKQQYESHMLPGIMGYVKMTSLLDLIIIIIIIIIMSLFQVDNIFDIMPIYNTVHISCISHSEVMSTILIS